MILNITWTISHIGNMILLRRRVPSRRNNPRIMVRFNLTAHDLSYRCVAKIYIKHMGNHILPNLSFSCA